MIDVKTLGPIEHVPFDQVTRILSLLGDMERILIDGRQSTEAADASIMEDDEVLLARIEGRNLRISSLRSDAALILRIHRPRQMDDLLVSASLLTALNLPTTGAGSREDALQVIALAASIIREARESNVERPKIHDDLNSRLRLMAAHNPLLMGGEPISISASHAVGSDALSALVQPDIPDIDPDGILKITCAQPLIGIFYDNGSFGDTIEIGPARYTAYAPKMDPIQCMRLIAEDAAKRDKPIT